MDEKMPHETPEVMPVTTFFNPSSLTVGSLIVALLLVVVLFVNQRRKKSKGNTFLLVGPSDGGKTTILSQLVYGKSLPTQTSMQPNASVFALSPKKPIQVVDIPGHPRLRNQFEEYMPTTKAIGFVVDANSISRNGPAVAEHLHLILHALTSLPPSRTPPALVIIAHKADLFKVATASNSGPDILAINRVKSILERELEKRRIAQSGGVNIEGLGEEGEAPEMGGLECGEKAVSTFKFDDWEGGEVSFVGTSASPRLDEKEAAHNQGLQPLLDWLQESM